MPFFFFWHYSHWLILASFKIVLKHPASNFRSSSTEQYLWGGLSAPVQPPTWRTRVSLFVWVITFDLFGMGGPTSSYATASIAPRITRPRSASPLHQSRDTFGRGVKQSSGKIFNKIKSESTENFTIHVSQT